MNFKRFHESKNLFDEAYPDISGTIRYRAIFVGDGTFTLSTTTPYDSSVANVFLISGNVSSGASTPNNGAWLKHNVTTQSIDGYVTIAYRHYTGTTSPVDCQTMLNLGSAPLPYEPYGDTWTDIPHYIHNTSTDIITTFPADIFPNAATATVGLKGNMEQSSQPSPTTPIQPSECGDKTANLWNEEGFSARAITSTHEHTDTNTYGTTLSTTIGKETIITQSEYPTGTVGYQNGFFFIDVDFSKYEIGDKVTLSFDYICNEVHSIEGQVSTTLYAGKNSNSIPVVLSSGKWGVSGRLTAVITVIADMNPYVEVRLCGNSITVKNIMLNTGSTALPYEPYGYKIPISSANTTTPIYLGEVETTRKVKKLVLTGEETSWNEPAVGIHRLTLDGYMRENSNIPLCTHYIGVAPVSAAGDIGNLRIAFLISASGNNYMYIRDSSCSTVSAFKTYLAQQYAAGTPVTIWYVLATEETGIVNEPLMKIGDYADTLSNISIPVTAGGDTLSVGTTVQPSEVTVNYKGWHPVADVHERDNGAWT